MSCGTFVRVYSLNLARSRLSHDSDDQGCSRTPRICSSSRLMPLQNKLSRQEMVDILNAVSPSAVVVDTAYRHVQVVPGGFDFVYLRFDFDNRCNVCGTSQRLV